MVTKESLPAEATSLQRAARGEGVQTRGVSKEVSQAGGAVGPKALYSNSRTVGQPAGLQQKQGEGAW